MKRCELIQWLWIMEKSYVKRAGCRSAMCRGEKLSDGMTGLAAALVGGQHLSKRRGCQQLRRVDVQEARPSMDLATNSNCELPVQLSSPPRDPSTDYMSADAW